MSGKSAYRFLVPKASAREDPQTSHLAEKPGEMLLWAGSDRRIIVYSTHYNDLMNFVCIHPDRDAGGPTEGWNLVADKSDLLETFKEFPPDVVALLNKADPQTIKLWQLLDLPALNTWVNGRVALLGDAAHPFLPCMHLPHPHNCAADPRRSRTRRCTGNRGCRRHNRRIPARHAA